MREIGPVPRKRAVAHLRAVDPVLARIIDAAGPCRFRVAVEETPFAALASSILTQQITGKAAAAIEARLHALTGGPPTPTAILGATDTALRSCGLSRQKIAALRDLAAKACDGLALADIHRLDDEGVIEALTVVRGIGRWTAEMFLIFRLGRMDVLPKGDYGIRKAMQVAYGMRSLPKPARMERLARPWRPYRTIACWYLWRSLEKPAQA